VGDEHERRARLQEPVLEPVRDERIEVVRRLVEEQELGVRQEEPRERHPPPLAPGQQPRHGVEVGQGE
jgi:hypothetical protein